jgi:hypothetical protein
MVYYDKYGREVEAWCTHCQYRHGGRACTDEEIEKAFDTKECPHFEAGQCYRCAIYLAGNEEDIEKHCQEAFYPSGCTNFKC